MGRSSPSTQTVTQKTEIDPIQKSFLFGTPLPDDYATAMEARNAGIMGVPVPEPDNNAFGKMLYNQFSGRGDGRQGGINEGPSVGAPNNVAGYRGARDMFDGGGRQASTIGGRDFAGPNMDGSAGNDGPGRSLGYAQGGIIGLPAGGMAAPTMGGGMPNLSNREQAYLMGAQALQGAMQPQQPMMQGYALGGYVEGPGTGRSDDIPATIYQNGVPVQDAALSDGEFVMTERAVRGAGGGDREAGAARFYAMMKRFENGGTMT